MHSSVVDARRRLSLRMLVCKCAVKGTHRRGYIARRGREGGRRRRRRRMSISRLSRRLRRLCAVYVNKRRYTDGRRLGAERPFSRSPRPIWRASNFDAARVTRRPSPRRGEARRGTFDGRNYRVFLHSLFSPLFPLPSFSHSQSLYLSISIYPFLKINKQIFI